MSEHNPPRFNMSRLRIGRRGGLATVGAGLLVLGGATGAVVMAQTRPSVSMAPAVPVAIRSLSSTGIVTIRGRVAEVFGNKFVMDDGSARALVDTGREGDDHALVTVGAPVTVQGRFDRGFVHAAFLVGRDGKVQALEPLGGPRHGPHGGPHEDPDGGPHDGRDGPDGGPHDGPNRDLRGGPDRGPDAPVPSGAGDTARPAPLAGTNAGAAPAAAATPAR